MLVMTRVRMLRFTKQYKGIRTEIFMIVFKYMCAVIAVLLQLCGRLQ